MDTPETLTHGVTCPRCNISLRVESARAAKLMKEFHDTNVHPGESHAVVVDLS